MTTTTNREQEKLGTDLRRSLLHLNIASYTLQELRDNRLTKTTRTLAPYVKELATMVGKAIRKFDWFIGVSQKIADEPLKQLIERDLNLTNANFVNIADLSEWVIETNHNIDNEIDIIINHTRRRDIMLRSWKAALGGELSPHDEMRFNAWYNANFHGDINSVTTKPTT